MKKLIGMILALVMVFSLSVTAMAAEGSWDGTSHTGNEQNVTATYEEGTPTQPAAVYSVKIEWSTPTITYTKNADTYQWNPTKLQYEKTVGTDGTWTNNNTTTVTVKNRSDAVVYASVEYTDEDGDNATSSATWKIGEDAYNQGEKEQIGSAAVSNSSAILYTDTSTTGSEQTCVFTGTITVTGSIDVTGQIGTITVTLEKNA